MPKISYKKTEDTMQAEKIKIEINQLERSEKILHKAYKTGHIEFHDAQSIYDELREKHQ